MALLTTGTHQNDEAQHREHVQRLRGLPLQPEIHTQQPQAQNPAYHTQWHTPDYDQRVEPRFEKFGHQQIR